MNTEDLNPAEHEEQFFLENQEGDVQAGRATCICVTEAKRPKISSPCLFTLCKDSLLPRVPFLLSPMDLSDGHSFEETFSYTRESVIVKPQNLKKEV